VFDIPIEIEDPLKTKGHAILNSLEGQPMKEIMAAEDDVSPEISFLFCVCLILHPDKQVATLAYTIRTSREKRDFLLAFSCVTAIRFSVFRLLIRVEYAERIPRISSTGGWRAKRVIWTPSSVDKLGLPEKMEATSEKRI
jgi:hypothetical protein